MVEFAQPEGGLGNGSTSPIISHIEAAGKLLAISLGSSAQRTVWVVVWDWNRGVEVTVSVPIGNPTVSDTQSNPVLHV